MKLNNISEGQILKNYKALCAELEIEIKKNTNSKKAQLKELSRYCDYSKMGHQFIIKQIYNEPLPKAENRGKSKGSRNNNNTYGNMIQLLILDLLVQGKNRGQVTISRSKLLRTIEMVNPNYSYCGEHVKGLAKYAETEEAIVYDFYNTSNSNFKSAIETALKQLVDKRIIFYESVTKVCEKVTNQYRLATEEEKELILQCEKSVLEEFGYKRISQVRSSRHWKRYRDKVQKVISIKSDINFHFIAYNITVNEKYIKGEYLELFDLLLEDIKRTKYKDELNATVYLNLIHNAQKRHEKASITQKMGVHRAKNNYIEDISKLVRLLIDKENGSIVKQIQKIESEERSKEECAFG
ncbi:hypothetical protein [Alkalihalophilus marmarensis]|uniref:Uncharacterized protein n=1 Tax=Alkalihalophilus marmarensis DSM 21297 TaxID=1188261 RepID=U6SUG7_9BACI|nr:hypothetical protein [Alkalihalophilus marmarensis]ERN54306.1 hypothetical protein A33I_07720 [Alkalihalophilus marmarensis DSM 21297]